MERVEPKTDKPWQPSPSSVVCGKNFDANDYTTTLFSK